ncbi:hypothetical protein [Shimia thalassica]|uniref:hypothetical protein n=1 Tax=Shimia thalassica TaxID=1715693 RepID=UPI0026E415E9|nr:hypothetical protein [Shimia thalassica]MDO6799724.1 hypothetical protein [Shimia thalassica]
MKFDWRAMRSLLAGSRRPCNYFHCDADNVGDRLCGPANYFARDQFQTSNLNKPLRFSRKTVFGGGQIFGQIERAVSENFYNVSNRSLVAWGIGLPIKGKRNDVVRQVASKFDFFGTRNFEWADEFDFVPCASCMSTIFDDLPSPKYEYVVFAHRRKVPELIESLPQKVPMLTNKNHSPRTVAEFLASGETVVTSSYHGVYWAQLIGRKVVCIPFGDKFRTFQFSPHFAQASSWQDELELAKESPPILEEYRRINRSFFDKVSNSLGVS